jgi:hypothetical protein
MLVSYLGEWPSEVVPKNTGGNQFPAIPAVVVEYPCRMLSGAKNPNAFVLKAVHRRVPVAAK